MHMRDDYYPPISLAPLPRRTNRLVWSMQITFMHVSRFLRVSPDWQAVQPLLARGVLPYDREQKLRGSNSNGSRYVLTQQRIIPFIHSNQADVRLSRDKDRLTAGTLWLKVKPPVVIT
jgi:hypothetical protein